MRALRWPLRVYIAAVLCAGAATIATLLVVAPPVLTESQLALAVALFAMAVLGQLWPVHLSVKMKVTVEDPATLAAALLLSPLLAVLVAGGSRAVGLRDQGVRSRWYNRG